MSDRSSTASGFQLEVYLLKMSSLIRTARLSQKQEQPERIYSWAKTYLIDIYVGEDNKTRKWLMLCVVRTTKECERRAPWVWCRTICRHRQSIYWISSLGSRLRRRKTKDLVPERTTSDHEVLCTLPLIIWIPRTTQANLALAVPMRSQRTLVEASPSLQSEVSRCCLGVCLYYFCWTRALLPLLRTLASSRPRMNYRLETYAVVVCSYTRNCRKILQIVILVNSEIGDYIHLLALKFGKHTRMRSRWQRQKSILPGDIENLGLGSIICDVHGCTPWYLCALLFMFAPELFCVKKNRES